MIRTHAVDASGLAAQRAAGLDVVTVGGADADDGIAGEGARLAQLAQLLGVDPTVGLGADTVFALSAERLMAAVDEAIAVPASPKVALLGPVSFLHASASADPAFDRLSLLERLLPVYEGLLVRLATRGVTWIQLDEPILGLDLAPAWQDALRRAYARLAAVDPQLLVAATRSPLGGNATLACELPVRGLHLDAAEAPEQVLDIARRLPRDRELSVGIADRDAQLPLLSAVSALRGGRLWVAAPAEGGALDGLRDLKRALAYMNRCSPAFSPPSTT